MTDEWLSEVIAHCRNHPDWLNILVSRKDLLACMQDLQRLRKRESLALPRDETGAISALGALASPQALADGTCFYCKGKVK